MAAGRPRFENRPGTDTPGLQSAVNRYVQSIDPKIDDWDAVVEAAVRTGNEVINNLDPLGSGRVRLAVEMEANPTRGTGVTESAALYIRVNHGATYAVEDRFQAGIYGEVDQYQHLAGNGFSKVVHRGWGDAHFVALMNTGDRVPITGASNTAPIIITTARKHGFGHDNTYLVEGVLGNTAANANAWYACKVLDEYRLQLGVDALNVPSAGSGAYTSGGEITCINSQVGYEAAHFSEQFTISGITSIPGNRGGTAADRAPYVDTIGRANGAVGFLSSIQAGFMPGGDILPDGDLTQGVDVWNSGLGRNKLFEALVENDQLFTGGCFIASDTPNRAFCASKRQFFQDAVAIGGFTPGVQAMYCLEEAYYNPQNNNGSAEAAMKRWQVQADATMVFNSLLATAGNPKVDAPKIKQYGSYWDGADPLEYGMWHFFGVTATSPAGQYEIYMGRPGFEAPIARFTSTGSLILLGPTPVLDMQLGQILAVSDLAFRDSLQGQAAAPVTHTARLATVAALPACTPAGTGVGHTLTANAVGVLSADGTAVVVNDVLLVKDEVATSDNGLYLCTTEGTAGVRFVLTRATDFDQAVAGEVATYQGVLVTAGATLAGTTWQLATGGAITVDTTGLAFVTPAILDSPDVVLDGTYWNGAASKAYGVRQRFVMESDTPKGYLTFMFGEPPFETPTFFFHDNMNMGIGGTGDATDNYGDGKGVLFIAAAAPAPSATPLGGGILYVNAAGELRYLSALGVDNLIA